MSRRFHLLLRLAFWAAAAVTATVAAAQAPAGTKGAAPAIKLRVVGGLGSVNQYELHERPFWTQELARLSGGRYSADIEAFDRAGVPGAEMARLMQLGVVSFGTLLISQLSIQYPQYAAMDLAG
ncbi:MAG: ABC transporter substrate-binding protein, partial [Proteobacteria bacterium]|nr:ABC transporter substrate-binding protein [Pseudomonadota bacterium]